MLLAFFAYHRLIFLQHANVSKHFRQTFLHAFRSALSPLPGVVSLSASFKTPVDVDSQHLSVDVIRIVSLPILSKLSQTQSGYVRLILMHS